VGAVPTLEWGFLSGACWSIVTYNFLIFPIIDFFSFFKILLFPAPLLLSSRITHPETFSSRSSIVCLVSLPSNTNSICTATHTAHPKMYLPRGAPVFAFLSLLICVSPTCVLSEDLKSRQNQNKDPPATTSGPASSVATTTSPIHALPHSSSSPSTGSGPSSTQGPTSTSKSATYFTVPITTPSTTTAVSCPTGPPRR